MTDTSFQTAKDLAAMPVEDQNAPILWFDAVPALGVGQGVGRVMLCAYVHSVSPDGTASMKKVVVGHLRSNGEGFGALRAAIDQMEAIFTPPANQIPN